MFSRTVKRCTFPNQSRPGAWQPARLLSSQPLTLMLCQLTQKLHMGIRGIIIVNVAMSTHPAPLPNPESPVPNPHAAHENHTFRGE